ncbi:MAG: beta-sandwich domain-containing protein [Pseudobdellovibrionaceae bacterium]
MKLPIIASLLVISTVLQSPLVSAQIRPGPSHGPEGSRGGERPGRYEDNRGGEGRGGYNGGGRPGGDYDHDRGGYYGGGRPGGDYDHDRDDRGGGYRPEPRPYPGPYRPEPRPYPGPYRPEPRPYPHPYPGPYYPEPRPYPRPYPAPAPAPYPRPAPYPGNGGYNQATAQFYGVTRSVGGEWLRVSFNYPAYIDYVTVYVNRAGLQVHEAYAVTESGRRILLNSLSYSAVVYAGQSLTSEYVAAGERITAVDIRAESMGDYADVSVQISSRDGNVSVYPTRY